MSSSTIAGFVSDSTDTIMDTLTLSIPYVLAAFAALVALALIVGYLKRWVGRK